MMSIYPERWTEFIFCPCPPYTPSGSVGVGELSIKEDMQLDQPGRVVSIVHMSSHPWHEGQLTRNVNNVAHIRAAWQT